MQDQERTTLVEAAATAVVRTLGRGRPRRAVEPPEPREPAATAARPAAGRPTKKSAAGTAPAGPRTSTPSTPSSAARKKPAVTPRSKTVRPADLAYREGEEPWTAADVKEVRGELEAQRDRLLALLSEHEAELAGLMRDSGDGAGQDTADVGASSFERDHELVVVATERDTLAQVEKALAAFEEGTYGTCESCGEPIGKMRMMAFPRATLCLTCKQREERR